MQFLLDRFDKNKDKIALIWNDNTYSYKWLLEKIEFYSNLILSYKLNNTIVFLNTEVNPNSIAFLLASIKNNIIFIPYIFNNNNELNHLLEISKPNFLIELINDEIKIIEKFNNFDTNPLYIQLLEHNKAGLDRKSVV